MRIVGIAVSVSCMIAGALYLFTSVKVDFWQFAFLLALAYLLQGISLLKDNRTIKGSVMLVISTMMAFMVIDEIFPIT
ncbi:hypothetical protein [Halobacillus sp. H74]|uniref:hypothetical protein n=1 Tax=Halobacillus sp. H74 TaxID=3457436 RepID=UPI003FCD5330